MATIVCPSCGSKKLATVMDKKSFPIVYGMPAEWDEKVYHCLICGERGDFSDNNDELAEKAIDLAKKQSVNTMLDSLVESGIKMAYLERAFELPPRTSSRWKAGASSASSIALIRIIRTFPWIVDVADAHFEPRFAAKRLLQEAGQVVYDAAVEANTKLTSIAVVVDTGKVNISACLEFDNPLFTDNMMIPIIHNLTMGGD